MEYSPFIPPLRARFRTLRTQWRWAAATIALSCGAPEQVADDHRPKEAPAIAKQADVDSAAAAKIAAALVTGVMDTANIEVLRFTRTDSGYVFALRRKFPTNELQLDGPGWTVLVDSVTRKARILDERL